MSNSKKTLGSKKNNKFTLKQFAWSGFNMTVGVPFLGSLALLANATDSKHEGQGLGFNILWIFLVMGIIASTCAFAFAKLSRHHKQDNNGGAYIFARSAFGLFVGFIVLFLNYIIMPLVLANQILMLIKANFNQGMAGGSFWWNSWESNLGTWSNLVYDFIGIALSIVFILVAFLGTRIYKKATKYSMLIKWVSSSFLIIFGVVSACLPASSGNAVYWGNHSHISVSTFLSAFCACFYYFTGFEAFASSGATVQEPEKNIGKGIMIVMFASTLFYIVITALFMFAQSDFAQNISTGFWVNFEDNWGPYLHWLIYAGPVIMIVATIAMRSATVSMSVLYGGTTLQPMSVEGYLGDGFAKMNNDGFPIQAMKLHIIICTFTVAMWAIIPDIIVGIIGTSADFINVNTIISAASIFYILIYLIILLALLKFSFKGMIKTGTLESILYIISFLSLIIVVAYHFYQLFDNAFDPSAYITKDGQNEQVKNIAALAIEIGFFVACALFVYFVYFHYYRNKYAKRLANDSSVQQRLNYEFRLLDGWSFVNAKLTLQVNTFLNRRQKFVEANTGNLYNADFLTTYTAMSENFITSIREEIFKFTTRSERIEYYNNKHGNNVEKEIMLNTNSANKFLMQLQHKIRTGPSYHL